MEDGELLRTYLESCSEPAFAELVARHVDLVYSAALRVVSEPQMARDVTQEVFLKLARRGCSVREGKALAAWLYRVAQAQAANAVRAETRRRRREQEAMRMSEQEADAAAVWTALKPWLEEAMGTLNRTEQAAVVLRFCSDQSLSEVGRALDLSEEAARKRVSRALEKLRAFFAQRGVQVSSSALAAVLAAQTVQAAPVGLAASLTAASLAGATAASSTGLFSTIAHTLIMTKTTATIVAVAVVGAALTPLWLRKVRTPPPAPAPTAAKAQETPSAAMPPASPPELATRATTPAKDPAKSLLERVAALPPLTEQQIEAHVVQNKRSAESLLAAYRASADKSWLAEAASRFPNHPSVQYEVVAARASPEVQRQWIEAYKAAAPDNALAWYFSALDHFKAGEKDRALADLTEATRKPAFRAELASTLQALEELNLSGGRAALEAKVAAFQTCAQFPELPQMRDLAKAMQETAQQYRQQGDAASADALAGMGLALGAHLSDGNASQTVISQLVGMGIQKTFLQQLDPAATRDPLGRPVAEVAAAIQQRQAALKDCSRLMNTLMGRLDDTEWAVYMERVKLYGEEAALTWLKAKHGE